MQDSITIRNIGFITTHNSTQQAFRRQVHITHCHTIYIAVFADDDFQSLGLCALQQGYGYDTTLADETQHLACTQKTRRQYDVNMVRNSWIRLY